MDPAICHSFPAATAKEDAARRDMELVAAARAGSSAAFEELQNLYSHRLYKRIVSVTGNHEDAEDALQDTFLRAYVALHSFEGRSQFISWLTRIAINSALAILRKRRSRAEVSFDLPCESEEHSQSFDVRDPALNPEQTCDQRQRCFCALRAVHTLHPKLRTPLSMWMKQERSLEEVARTLGLSTSAVRSRLHRARKRLNRNTSFREPQRNSGSLSGTKRRRPARGFQNREQPCLSCN